MRQIVTRYSRRNAQVRPGADISYRVPSCQGRRFAIPDIHGCLQTLQALVDKLEFTQLDQLFFLGDMIDRGRESRGVMDYILWLKDTFHVFSIRGNHEDDLLLRWELQDESLIDRYMEREEYPTLFNPDRSIDPIYIEYLTDLPFFLELEHCLLVHAGFDFNSEDAFTNTEEMIWTRNWDYDAEQAGEKSVVYGHNPSPLPFIRERIEEGWRKLPLDNGCVYSGYEGYGNLLALDLDSFQLVIQENIES